MRKITEKTVKAFLAGNNCTVGNTSTDGESLWLHGNKIAWKENGKIYISSCGWETPTTKDRLNGLLDILGKDRIYQVNFTWYRGLDDKPFFNGMEV